MTFDTSAGLSWNVSGSTTNSDSESVSYTNSSLLGNNISIKSKSDTTVSGGVVTAENKLNLDIGGNLTVESLQDTSNSSSYTLGISMNGGKDGITGAGNNFNINKSKSKWVAEQTSLTGGSVDINVEKKTTLTGALIASTSENADLKLTTGSLEYSDLKDSERSYGVGGGVNGGSSKSVDGNYNLSDKRQKNFATIGEGTITVKDPSTGSGTGLEGLNRNVEIAQYETKKETGLQGSFRVDDTTVDMIAHPIKTGENLVSSLQQGYRDAKETTLSTAVKTGNLYKGLKEGDGLTWESQEERVERLSLKLKMDQIEDAFGGDSILERKRNVIDGELELSGYVKGDLLNITDPEKLGQGSANLRSDIGEVYDELNKDISVLNFDSQYDEVIDGYNKKMSKLQLEIDTIKIDGPITKEESLIIKNKEKEISSLYDSSLQYEKYKEDRKLIREYVDNTPKEQFVNETVSKLCNPLAYWAVGTDKGYEDRSIKTFYKEELIKGNIGSVNKDGKANAYWGTGGNKWAENYNITRTIKNSDKTPLSKTQIANFINENNGKTVILYTDKKNAGNGTHYHAGKVTNNQIMNYDNNRRPNTLIKVIDKPVYKISY